MILPAIKSAILRVTGVTVQEVFGSSEQIAEATGQRPKGNPSLTTLREMLSEAVPA